MRKITKEEFIQKASTIHNNKYLYDKVNYVNKLKYNYTDEEFNNLCNQINDRTGLISKCEKGGKL